MKLNFARPPGEGPWPRRLAVLLVGLLLLSRLGEPPIALAFDPDAENCLPDVHLALLVRHVPQQLAAGDYVFWKPAGPTSHIRRAYLLKRVAGVAGDRLRIHDGQIRINGVPVASGLALLDTRQTRAQDFERNETIPPGQVFVLGSHALSFDSRYWGYLDMRQIAGLAYKLL